MSLSAAVTRLTREEILDVYAEGPEAVVALVTALCARLGRATATDSHDSGRPPSTDRTRSRDTRPTRVDAADTPSRRTLPSAHR